MRTRTILAAAAAPAALAAVLLGTAGQASAQVVSQPTSAVLTASVKQAVYKLNVHQHAVADTTDHAGDGTINNDSSLYGPIGPVWAFDNMERQFTATSLGGDQWAVTQTITGTYNAFADPNTGAKLDKPVTGPISATLSYTVTSTTPPVDLPAQLDDVAGGAGAQWHSGDIVSNWFQISANNISGGTYHFEYKGLPGGLYVQNG
jgi:hypothetical protein